MTRFKPRGPLLKLVRSKPLVYCVSAKNARDLAKAFMRVQEYYESPKFRGKFFSVQEFKDWYKTQRNGRFTYFSDWSGFNVPSSALKALFYGPFSPLTPHERELVELLAPIHKQHQKFYVIGISDKNATAIDHELTHALYFCSSRYRAEVNRILRRSNTRKLEKWLKAKGYHKSVWLDEMNAYLVNDQDQLDELGLFDEKLATKLQNLFMAYNIDNDGE